MNIARKLRTWFPGAVYHIMHRGVRRRAIFQEEMDYQVLLKVLKNSLEKYKCILHAYCLMTNHIHLLLETGDMEIEYSCAVTPQVRQTGNRLSGLAGTAYASLLT